MKEIINRWEVSDSDQYPGMLELTGIDGMLRRYYLCTTPAGRICLRKTSDYPSDSAEEGSVGATQDAPTERKAFEAWIKEEWPEINLDWYEPEKRYYMATDACRMFDSWKAARAAGSLSDTWVADGNCGDCRQSLGVAWNTESHLWEIACRTCWNVFRLIPTGSIEFVRRAPAPPSATSQEKEEK